MAKYLGIDCGATNLRVGIVDQDGKLFDHFVITSPLKHEPDKLAEIVKEKLGRWGEPDRLDGIGVGVPGPLDLKRGLILPSSNLGNTVAVPIMTIFDRVFNIRISLDRDTIVALMGEVWQGAAVGLKEVVMLTLGSGVGGAVLINGEVDRGADGHAGEIGHMYLQLTMDNVKLTMENVKKFSIVNSQLSIPKCGFGHQGCLEAWINSAKDLDQLGTYLGYGLANMVDIFNPELILISGGKVTHLHRPEGPRDLLTKAIKVMKEKGMKPAVDEVRVEYAKLGEMAGVLGAAKLAMKI